VALAVCVPERAPLRACGELAHSNMASGMVAMPGLMALITSTSGSELPSSVGRHRAVLPTQPRDGNLCDLRHLISPAFRAWDRRAALISLAE
jgi:hypothetical protein